MDEIERIINSIKDTYSGNPWHGPSVKDVLSKIKPEQSMARIGKSHSIIELVLHMAAWRTFVSRRLKGDHTFEINDEMNFPSGSDWPQALGQLDQSQEELLDALAGFDESKLSETVPSRNYSFYKILHGIVTHDIYHQGQITMIIKQF